MEDTQIEQVENIEEVGTDEDVGNETQKVSEIHIPENWESGLKDFVNGIEDQAGKKAVFDKISSYEQGYQKKFQDLAKQRKAFEADKVFLDNYRNFENGISDRQILLAKYGSMPAYFNRLYQMDKLASENPEQFLINYCNGNGITMEQLQQVLSGEKSQRYQQERSLDARDAELLRKFEEQQQQKAFEKEVMDFANATDSAGNLLHPYMQELANDMDYFVEKGLSLQEAYDKALRLNDNYYQESIDKRIREIEQAKEVEKAKGVVGVRSKIPSASAIEHKNWRDVLDESLEK
jgi:hypothetical protein